MHKSIIEDERTLDGIWNILFLLCPYSIGSGWFFCLLLSPQILTKVSVKFWLPQPYPTFYPIELEGQAY